MALKHKCNCGHCSYHLEASSSTAIVNACIISWTKLLFVTAVFSPVLRPELENPITLFRILLPVYIFSRLYNLSSRKASSFTKLCLVCLGVLVYSLGASALFGGGITSVQLLYGLNVAVLILVMGIVYLAVYSGTQNNAIAWYNLLTGIVCVLLFTSYTERAFDLQWSFKVAEGPGAIATYAGQNDLSLALAGYILFVYPLKPRNWLGVALLVLCFETIIANESRAILCVVAVVLSTRCVLLLARSIRIEPKSALILGISLVVIGGAAAAWLTGLLDSWFFSVIGYLTTGQGNHEQLGMQVRLEAAYTILRYYLASFGFGIGGGSCVVIIEDVQVSELIKSLHLFPLQCLFEYGWLYLGGMITAGRLMRRCGVSTPDIMYWLSMVILTPISNSDGAITNYFFFGSSAAYIGARSLQKRGAVSSGRLV